MLEAVNLRKTFGTLVAVDDVSLRLEKGETVGLLGPNGAGKTTTVSMLCGLATPDRGRVSIDGRPLGGDTNPGKRKIGLVPQDLALYEELSARDNLQFFGALYGLAGAELEAALTSAFELVGLADRARDRVKVFSGGMKRRLNLAAGLLHDPDILLLDEPTVGVDPQSRNAIFDNLEQLKSRGKALLYTTHYIGRSAAPGRPHRDHRSRQGHRQRHRRPDSRAEEARSNPCSSRSRERLVLRD